MLLIFCMILLLGIKESSGQIYSKLPSYRGYDLNCTLCQGNRGDPCDVDPLSLPHTVQCRGSCITWRTLYNTGRALRTIYRGCGDTVFPSLLPELAKDGCAYDNFFVQCSTLCDDDHRCNQNGTGIPRCWDCEAKFQSCDIEPAANCSDPEPVTEAPVPWEVSCVSCVGKAGSQCDLHPEKVVHTVKCNDTCISWRSLTMSDRSTKDVWRGCKSSLFPHVLNPEALDSCDFSDAQSIQCSVQCNGHLCNKYSTGISTTCWNEKAELRDRCKRRKQISNNPFVNQLRESYAVAEFKFNDTNSTLYDEKYLGLPINWWSDSAAMKLPNPINLLCGVLSLLLLLYI
ncbi:hypothetical protein EB796_003839 [Bugula neritina]|uniref:Uncharacterized protein n=1 Tax=Bugula neritina TaxID=10212 RepID=A0A7J7KGQ6_BUGNE|nr:hypothetical protein EB796_003839 [Bugula neritina]